MKNLRYISVIMMICLTSCEYDFKIKNMPTDSLLHIVSSPGLSDNIEVRLKLAEPAGGIVKGIDVTKTNLVLKINGIEEPLTLRQEEAMEKSEMSAGEESVFFSSASIKAGDNLSLKAYLDGVKQASAETTVPEKAPEFSVVFEIKGRDLIAKISIEDNPATEDFYAVRLIHKCFIRESGKEQEDIYYNKFNQPSKNTHSELVNESVMQYDDLESFFIMSDESSQNGVCNINAIGTRDYDYSSTYQEETFGRWNSYKVICYKLSPEYYYYYHSRYEVDNNSLGTLGWAPVNFAYTNISGGLGVFGAVLGSESQWFSNSSISEKED